MPTLVRQTFRTDICTAEALKRLAESERKALPEVLREAVRLRLDLGEVAEHVRVAIAEATVEIVGYAKARIDALGTEWRDRLVETETHERGLTQQALAEFIEVLAKGALAGEPEEAPPASYATLTPRPSKRVSP